MDEYVVGAVSNIISGVGNTEPFLKTSTELIDKEERKKSINKKTVKSSLSERNAKKCKLHEEPSEKIFNEGLPICSYLTNISNQNIYDRSERECRTIFVGNLPITVKKHKLKKWFSKFGEIETIRLRSAPISDPRIPKKVAAIKKSYHEKRHSIIAYVRFQTQAFALAALKANGQLFDETHHLRIDIASNKYNYDIQKAIFIGNLPFAAEEEDIRKLFKECGEIDSVRVIRDSATGIGKGIGYVNFQGQDAVELALEMDGINFQKRSLRIKRASIKKKHNKTSILQKSNNVIIKIKKQKNEKVKRQKNDAKSTLKEAKLQASRFQGLKAYIKNKIVKGMNNQERKKKIARNILLKKHKKEK